MVAVITHVLVDFGEVISRPQAASSLEKLARLSGVPQEEVSRRYWQHRGEYDRGQSSIDYWSIVVGRRLDAETALLDALVAADVEGWMRVDLDSLRVLTDLSRTDRRLALLSNAPHPIADAVDASAWAALFPQRFFSCRLEIIKPDPEIFERVLATMGAEPEHTLFIDDRHDNTAAAAKLGLTTITFTSVKELEAALQGL